MAKVAGFIMLAGALLGIVGGFADISTLYHGGMALLVLGVAVLCVYSAIKAPSGMQDTFTEHDEFEPQPPKSDVFAMETELRRKDRGAEQRGG